MLSRYERRGKIGVEHPLYITRLAAKQGWCSGNIDLSKLFLAPYFAAGVSIE